MAETIEWGDFIKSRSKWICLILSIFLFILLAGCGQGKSDKMIDMPVKNYFDQQEIIVKIPKKSMMFGNTLSEGGFMSYDAFVTVKDDFIKNNPGFKFKEYGDHCLLMTTGESGAMRHYLLTLYSDINYGVFAPFIYTDHITMENGLGMAGEKLYFPVHLLHYSSQRQRMDFLGKGVNEVRPNTFYQIKGSQQEFKQFYLDTGYFDLTETPDGFSIKLSNNIDTTSFPNILEKTYQLHFQTNGNINEVMYTF